MSNVKRFFSYRPDGFLLHETAEEAKAEAEAAWSLWTYEEVTEDCRDICWGEVRGVMHEEILHHHGPKCRGENGCPEGHYGASEHDYAAEYSLVDLPPTPDPEIERLQAKLDVLRAAMRSLVVFLVEEGKQSRANLQTGPQLGQIVRVVHESGYHLKPRDRPPMDGQVGVVFGHATPSGVPCVCIEFGRCRMTLPVGDVEAVDQAERRWEELATRVCALLMRATN